MKRNITHGQAVGGKITPIYRIYLSMVARCQQPSSTNYKYYGGKGIKVCKEWRDDPQKFFDWAISHKWSRGLDVDRVKSNGDYHPDNCRIITHRENSQRTSRIKTTIDQARIVKEHLAAGENCRISASAAGVSYMVAWHIKNNPDVWSNA